MRAKDLDDLVYGLWNTAWADGYNQDKTDRETRCERAKQEIVKLMGEIIGEDEKTTFHSGLAEDIRNHLRATQRKRLKELV